MLYRTIRSDALEPGEFIVRGLSRAEISDDILSQWRDLEVRSLEGNAYLSPHFVMPAARHLNPDADLVFLLASRPGDPAGELCGLGVFERRRGDKRFPLPYWRAYKSRHSFLTGVLVDARFPEGVLDAFFAFLKQERLAVDFPECLAEGQLAEHLRQAAARGGWLWESRYQINRAYMVPARCGDSYIEATVSPKSRKRLRSQANRLSQHGEMSWHLSRGDDPECVERLLELEHMGWKGEDGTSLRAGSGDEAFVRAMVEGFSSERRVFFTELRVGGEVIASTVNLISGTRGFAFKMGWNPAFAPFSPSILNVLELTRQAGTELAELELIDSGAGEGSFVDKIWDGRYPVAAGVYRHVSLPRPLLGGMRFLRQLRDRFRR